MGSVGSRLSTAMASQGEISAVEVYTTNEPVMAKQIHYKGMILVSKNKSRNMFSDIGSGFKSLVGGEIKGLSKLTSDLRDELLWELKEKAAQAGANAVVGLRVETNTIFEGVLDMVVYELQSIFRENK